MTVKQDIENYLANHGRSTVSDIANAIGFSHGHVLSNAKEMASNGRIQGKKVPKRIPAAIVNGEFEVLSNSHDELLNIVRKHAPQHVGKAQNMSPDQLRDFIADNLASRTLAFKQGVWEFW